MRVGGLLVAFVLSLSGCGLETVEYLPKPPVDSYLSQSQYHSLLISQNSGYYSGARDFQGYEIYYKIYPVATGAVSSNLANDVNRLNTTPTRDYLLALGYQRMNAANDHSTTVPLVSLGPDDVTAVTLDFSNLADVAPGFPLGSAPASPVPRVTFGNGASPVPVFRNVTTSGNVTYPYFNELFTWSGKASDMDSTVGPTTSPYEIDIFIVAYAFTLEKTTYSQPVPWGVLKELRVPQ